jgi:hypothetical protein
VEIQRKIAAIPAWNAGVSGYYRTEDGLNVTQWPDGMQYYQDVTSGLDTAAYETAKVSETA